MKVNYHSGEICASGLDIYVSGFVSLDVARTYSSFQRTRSSFGTLWTCSTDVELVEHGGSWEFLSGGSPLPVHLEPSGIDPRTCDAQQLPHLDASDSDRLVLVTGDRRRYIFSRFGGRNLLQRVEDLDSNGWTYDYDHGTLSTLRDDLGRELRPILNTAGWLVRWTLGWPVRRIEPVTVASYEYDSRGWLVAMQDALGNGWKYEYVDGLLVSERNPLGGVECASYDAQRRCIATWRCDGSRARYLSYDEVGKMTRVINGLGRQWLYLYDDAGNMVRRIDPAGGQRETHYDLAGAVIAHTGVDADGMSVLERDGRTTEIVHANGATTVVTRSPTGNPTQMVDANGNTWQWQYDAHDELTAKVAPTGAVTQYRISHGFLEEMGFPNGARFWQTLDRRTGTITMSDSVGALCTLEFDVWGLLTAITDGCRRRVEMQRDRAGRVVRVTDHQGWEMQYQHDAMGNVIAARRACGQTDVYEFDRFGRLVQHVDPLGARVVLSHGPEETLNNVRDPNGRLHTYEYDELARVVRQQFFDGRDERYLYDGGGEIEQIIPEKGRPTVMTYDEVGLMVEKSAEPGSSSTFAYDALRQLLSVEHATDVVSFEYDSEGRVTAELQNEQKVDFAYDSVGNCLSWLPAAAPPVHFEYDGRGRVIRLRDAELGTFQFEYDLSDFLVKIIYPNHMSLDYDYDGRGNVTQQQLIRGGKKVWERRYRYDAGCRLVEVQSNGRQEQFHYDAADQLVQAQRAAGQDTFSYDPSGNLLSINSAKLKYDSRGRLASSHDTAFEYSADGLPCRIMYQGQSYDLAWDGEQRLARCQLDGGEPIEFGYDMAARLLWSERSGVRTTYLWCGALLYAQFVDQRLDTRYVYHPQLLMPLSTVGAETKLLFVPDFRGQVAAAVDPSGTVTEYDYTAFGALRRQPPKAAWHPFRLPGQLAIDDLPFHYNRFRYFLPAVGRYVTPDPIGLLAGSNLYAYALNSIQGVDYLGLCDGEKFYRAMSDAELKAVMKDCKIHNKPESESMCHEAFVTQRKDYSQKLQARHPDKYPNLVEFCCQHGTASAMQNRAISAASNSAAASRMFPTHSRAIKGLTNIIHLKFEQVSSRADQALNYGLRRNSVGTFNNRIKSAKAQPGGQSCGG